MKIIVNFILILFITSSCWPTSVSVVDKGGMPEEWKTFSLETLINNAPNAPNNLAVNLSEAIKDGIQNNTRLLINPQAGKGEIIIDGSINNYTIMPIALQEGDNANKNRLTVSVQVNISILKPKEDEMKLSSTRFVDYDATTDLATVENTLLEEVNKQIVQDVINKLLSNW